MVKSMTSESILLLLNILTITMLYTTYNANAQLKWPKSSIVTARQVKNILVSNIMEKNLCLQITTLIYHFYLIVKHIDRIGMF
jgi:hypothetical protein